MNKLIQQDKYLPLILWVVFFCYAICLALVFQNVIAPHLSTMMNGDGARLLSHDSVYFDKMAWMMAEDIRENGWGNWQFFVSVSAPGNVSILAALYAVFGHDSTVIIPINASIHALGGVLIFFLARELTSRKVVGIYAGLVAATLFVIFPSSLNWYGQIHKDGYAIAGTLLILLTWVNVINRPVIDKAWMKLLLWTCSGLILIGMVRPYGLTLLLVVSIGATLITLVTAYFYGNRRALLEKLIFFIISIVLITTGIVLTKEYSGQANVASVSSSVSSSVEQSTDRNLWSWKQNDLVPDKIEKYIAAAAKIRTDLIYHGKLVNARSTIDEDRTPDDILEVIAYLPRALTVAAMAPFPNMWFSQLSMTQLVATGEMIVYYLCFPGILFLLRYNRKPAVWMAIYFAVTFLTILGFTIANMGTIFRVRYAYLFILITLGIVGWVTFLERKKMLKKVTKFFKRKLNADVARTFADPNIKEGRKRVVGAGIYVSILTFLGFIGFFYRDVLMAHKFGLNAELDSFFVALLIPMTIVTIICIPFGAAFTPFFLASVESRDEKETKKLISRVSAAILVKLSIVCLALYFIVPYLLPYVGFENRNDDVLRVQELTRMAIPILFFSGTVILGNTILNALGKVVSAGLAQLIVPIIAIAAVVFYGHEYGAEAAILGMLLGQLFNLLIIQVRVRRYGYSLIPKFDLRENYFLEGFLSQYFPLIVAAFFMGVAVLVSTILATSLPEGGVSVFNLGSKVILLVTGLLGAAISTVMLPYFSSLIAKKHVIAARRELSVFLLFLTAFTIPISTGLFVYARPIVELIFKGGELSSNDLELVARVMQYATVQLPFFACNVLLLKYATATKHVISISIVAVLALMINIAASLLLMRHMGVPGIALGSSISMLLATTFLVMILVRYRHIGVFDMVTLLLTWLLFVTLLMSIHFGSISGIFVTIFTYFILVLNYGKSLFDRANMAIQVKN